MHFDLTDQYRHRESQVHGLDPRAKVLLVVLFILAASLVPAGAWVSFLLLAFLILLTAWMTRLGPTFALKRSFVALPFVLAALPVPLTTPGPSLFEIPVLGWTVSKPGTVIFLSILLRSWLAVQGAILLTATTRFPDLIWALNALHLPRPLVATVAFMYRYLFVLADEVLRMVRARSARSAVLAGRPKPSIWWQGRVAGNMVGSLFVRSLERSERVYAAMLSRGYDGQMRTLGRFEMTRKDGWAVFIGAVVLLSALAAGAVR